MAIDRALLLALLPLLVASCDAQKPVPEKVAEKLNFSIEEAFDTGDMQKVADFYDDSACLFPSEDRSTCGREEIDIYWSELQGPLDWHLTVEEASYDINDIYKSPYYQALEVKPPNWTEHGFELHPDDELLYHLGHSTLLTIRNGEERTSEVDFIVVWRKLPGEDWKILVDSYN